MRAWGRMGSEVEWEEVEREKQSHQCVGELWIALRMGHP